MDHCLVVGTNVRGRSNIKLSLTLATPYVDAPANHVPLRLLAHYVTRLLNIISFEFFFRQPALPATCGWIDLGVHRPTRQGPRLPNPSSGPIHHYHDERRLAVSAHMLPPSVQEALLEAHRFPWHRMTRHRRSSPPRASPMDPHYDRHRPYTMVLRRRIL